MQETRFTLSNLYFQESKMRANYKIRTHDGILLGLVQYPIGKIMDTIEQFTRTRNFRNLLEIEKFRDKHVNVGRS